jgi:glycine dehydrogenase subunit 1
MRYLPHTDADVRSMLRSIGREALDELVAHVPADLRRRAAIDLEPGRSEPEVLDRLTALAAENRPLEKTCFAGAGAYPHHVPAAVDTVISRSEFATAYTPYQPEVSQGTLQAIFEFQTLVTALCGLEVANASMYDGASATAEAVLMARRLRPKAPRVLLAASLPPAYRQVVRTYLEGIGDLVAEDVPFGPDGRIDSAGLDQALGGGPVAAVVVGYPSYFGVIEDLRAVGERARGADALLITVTPEGLALGLLREPGALGADIAVAEGQSFGLGLSFGGPYLGLFATRERFVRSMPGRLVSETIDDRGRRGFVLTLATREQHIRRERATSNICTNQGLCALAATVYLALAGRTGLRALADRNARRARHALRRLCDDAGAQPVFAAPFFNEFAIRLPGARRRWERALAADVIAGVPLGDVYPELDDALLLCVTEVHALSEIERLVEALRP